MTSGSLTDKIKKFIFSIISEKLRPIKSYIRRQIVFGLSLFLGLLFLLLALAEFLIEVLPTISRYIVLLIMGLALVGIGYLQKHIKFVK